MLSFSAASLAFSGVNPLTERITPVSRSAVTMAESGTKVQAAGLAADALDALRAFRSAPDIAVMAGRAWPDAQAVSREARALRRAAEAGAARYDSRRWVGGGRDR